jgi:hypothetical protein
MVTTPTRVDLKFPVTACYPEIKMWLLTPLSWDLKPVFPNDKSWYLTFKPNMNTYDTKC